MNDSLSLLEMEKCEALNHIGCGSLDSSYRRYYVFQRELPDYGPTIFVLRSDKYLQHVVRVSGEEYRLADGTVIKNISVPNYQGWGNDSILDFAKGRTAPCEFPTLFSRVRSILGRVIYLDEQSLALMSLFVISSYFTNLFPAVAYLHLRSNGPGSGKTHGSSILLKLSYNACSGDSIASYGRITAAALYKEIHMNRGMVALDDSEALAFDTPSDLRQCHLVGYKASSGTLVLVVRGKPKAYSVYGPRIFTSIGAAEPVIRSRTLEIILTPAPGFVPEQIPDEEYQNLRNSLFVASMSPDVLEKVREEVVLASRNPAYTGNRLGEISLGLAVIAKLSGVQIDFGRWYSMDATTPKKPVETKDLVMRLLREGFKGISIAHFQSTLALTGELRSETRTGIDLAGCRLLRPAGYSVIHGIKSTVYKPTKRAVILAGGRLSKESRRWCRQSGKKKFDAEHCRGCRYLEVCQLRKKLLMQI